MSELPRILQQKARVIAETTEEMLSYTNDWQTIRLYLLNRLGEFHLNERQQEKLKVCTFIYNHLISGKLSERDVMNMVMKVFARKESQVYEDMRATREIFNSVISIDKQFEITVQLQANQRMMMKAAEAGDFKAYAALEKNRAGWIAMLPDEDDNPSDIFVGHQIEAVFDPGLLGNEEEIDMKSLLSEINAKRGKKIKTELFEDIPHEEVKGND